MKTWGRFEKEVAKALGGIRRIRISYSEVAGDVIHSFYSIECKYGKQIPKKALEGRRCKFLDKAFEQARRYDATKEPVVCLKRPRMQGFIMIRAYPLSPRVYNHLPTREI